MRIWGDTGFRYAAYPVACLVCRRGTSTWTLTRAARRPWALGASSELDSTSFPDTSAKPPGLPWYRTVSTSPTRPGNPSPGHRAEGGEACPPRSPPASPCCSSSQRVLGDVPLLLLRAGHPPAPCSHASGTASPPRGSEAVGTRCPFASPWGCYLQ